MEPPETGADMKASPTKLRNGAWGARVQGIARPGDQIDIETRAGKRWTATVDRVVWTGEGVTLVSTASAGRSGSGRRTRRQMIDADEMCYAGHTDLHPGCRDCFDTFDC